MKLPISYFIILLLMKITTETDLLDKLDNLIHDKNLIYNEFHSNTNDSIKYSSKNQPNTNGTINKNLDDSITINFPQNQYGIENKLLINNVSISPTDISSISNRSSSKETLPNNFNNYQINNFQNPISSHINYLSLNFDTDNSINQNSSIYFSQPQKLIDISSSNSKNANDAFYNSNFNADLNGNNNIYNHKNIPSMVPSVNNNNNLPLQNSQIPYIQNNFSNSNVRSFYVQNQSQTNNLLSYQMGNYGDNNLLNMNNNTIPEDKSDVIFEHLFIDLNGEKELPNLKSKWIYDNYNNEFIVPEESKFYAIYF